MLLKGWCVGNFTSWVHCLLNMDAVAQPEDPVYVRCMNEVRSSHGPYAGKMFDAVELLRAAQYSRHPPIEGYVANVGIWGFNGPNALAGTMPTPLPTNEEF